MKKSCWWWFLLLLIGCVTLVHSGDHEEVMEEMDSEEEAIVEEEVTDQDIIAEKDDDAWWMEEITNVDDVAEPWYCSRISPKEIFHTDVHPRLLRILDEMSHMVEAILAKLEEALVTLLPHVDQSPIGKVEVDELFSELRHFMFGTTRDVYDIIRVAWRELIRVHTQVAPAQASPVQILAALSHVKEAQDEGEGRLMASLQEMTVTLKVVIYNSIYVTGITLKLPNNTDEHDAAIAISRTLPKIAPNFLGSMMKMIMERGDDPSAYKKILTDPLRSITPQVHQMYASLETIIENGSDAGAMEDYWSDAVRASHHGLKENPLLNEDYYLIFQNEEYLSELVLQLMASF